MDGSIRRSLLLSFLVLAPVLVAQQGPRQPRGVYAVVNVEDAINQAQKSNPSITTAQLDAYFDTFYQGLLADPAISGLTLQVHWDTVNPNAPPAANAYFWNYVDDAFSQVSAWNAQNPSGTPKTIQLIVSAGFQTPQWMLNQLTSCDGLFATPVQTPPSTCGKATFLGYQEGGDSTELPMPWNPLYKSAWQTFLTVLAVRYGVNPAFVSIAIAGPTGASAEMILPSDANSNNPQTQFGASISPSHMWLQLLALEYPSLPAYQNSDQAFIAEWEHAIDLYGQIFSGITLVATTGNGFPNFAGATVAIPSGYTADCVTPDLDCAAETTILSYFAQGAVGGANAKASQNSGMEASRVNINLSVPGVKQLSASTAQFTSPSYQILGGAQFNTSFVNDTLAEGCIDTFPPNASDTPADCTIPATCTANGCIPVQCIPQACLAPGVTQASLAIYQTYGKVPVNSLIPPEQAEYNVLSFYFSGTAVASSFGGTQGLAPLNYLQIYSEDIQYAEANVNAPAQVVQASGAVVSMTAQDLLNLASQKLLQLAEDGPAISLVANAEGESPIIAPNTWVEVKGSNLAPAGDTRIWQLSDFVNNKMPTQLDGVSATVNGKAAYVYYISPTQVNILTPPDAMAGAVQVVVTNNGSMSAAYTAQAQPLAPSFFVINGGPYALGQHGADSSLAGPASFSVPGYTFTPAKPGETVVLYANGFGAVSPAVVSGASSQTGTLNPLPTVMIGGIAATVQFAGINGPPGLFQFNVVVPASAPSGDNTLTATYNGVTTSPLALLTIQGSSPATLDTFYVAPNGNDSWSGTLAGPNPAGTDGPFATFDHARAAVQKLNKAGLSQVTVQFRGGTYFLPATEILTAADSGSATTQIVYRDYPGETPVISGGIPVQNWTNAGGNTWKTTLPVSTQYFENLFYNGVRRLRPRLGGSSGSPLGAYYRVANPVYLNTAAPPAAAPNTNCSVYVTGSGWECFDRFQYSPTDPISSTWKNLAPAAGNPCGQPAGNAALTGDIELLDFEKYVASKMRVSCVDSTDHIVYLTGPALLDVNLYDVQGFIPDHRYLVENIQDELTQPGQWFLDRSTTPWTLTYLANSGENPNTDTVIVPQLTEVLVASNLQYITFQGLTFEHDNYTVPALGHPDSEIPYDISAAVSFQNSQHITFNAGAVTQTSGAGLEFISCLVALVSRCLSTSLTAVTANNVVENSAFYDLGENGMRIGIQSLSQDTVTNVPQFTTVENNVVEGYGRAFPNAWGIAQGDGHDNTYTHNDVYDGYHTAIGACQCTSIEPPSGGAFNNTISFNHVYNLFQGIMNDAGSLYIAGGNAVFTAPGNKILNNKVHDVSDASALDADGYGGHGIYLDTQTGLVDVENNLVYRVSGSDLNFPMTPPAPNEANTIKNNIFASARLSVINDGNPYPAGSVPPSSIQTFVASNNLFYFDRNSASSPSFYVQGGCTYSGGFAYTQYQDWSSNLYWRVDGAFAGDAQAFHVQPSPGAGSSPCTSSTAKWTFYTFAGWQKTVGEDALSVVQNPGFNNPAYPADDYSLPKGSPGVGFVVFDPTQAGRSNPVIMPPAVPATFPTKSFNPATDF